MRIRSRASWKARPPKAAPSYFTAPAAVTYVHHTVTVIDKNATVEQEKAHMRYLQEIAFGRGFNDISYSFVVFASGHVYEGRGWKVVGAHTEGSNSVSHAFVFVGNYEVILPTPEQLESAAELHKRGKKRGHIFSGATVKGHRDAPGAQTACPGKYLYNRIDVIRNLAK